MKSSAFDDFNEYTQDVLDFGRYQRPDGSYSGGWLDGADSVKNEVYLED